MKRLILCLLVLTSFTLSHTAQAGKIVLANDEWTLGNTGFANAGGTNAATFAKNVAAWFTGGGTGSFLVYTDNFGLVQSNLQAAMTGAGHTWTINTGIGFTLANLSAFDAIFLGGPAFSYNATVLTDYVNTGRNVYLMGGTGIGGAAAEAARWNPFLNNFGLGFGSPYNGVIGNIPISSPHPIFVGVTQLYQNNGNDALDLIATDPLTDVLVSFGGHDLYAVFDSSAGNVIPEPSTWLLLGIGVLGIFGMSWLRRRVRAKQAP